MKIIILMVLVCFLSVSLRSEVVYLKSGKMLKGEIVEETTEKIILKTEQGGFEVEKRVIDCILKGVKVKMRTGETIIGKIKEEKPDYIVLETNMSTLKIGRGVILGIEDVEASVITSSKKPILPQPAISSSVFGDKTIWEEKYGTTQEARNGFWVVGGLLSIVGVGCIISASQVDTNVYKGNGNITTNQEAVDEYNRKMLTGWGVGLLGVVMILFGFKKDQQLDNLRFEGKRCGYVSMGVNKNKLSLVYGIKF